MLNKKRSKKVAKKYATRQRFAKVETALEEQFQTGRLLGKKKFNYDLFTLILMTLDEVLFW